MSDELSDKQIHQRLEKDSLSCPNCGARASLYHRGDVTSMEAETLGRLLDEGRIHMQPLEDGIEETKTLRDHMPGMTFANEDPQ